MKQKKSYHTRQKELILSCLRDQKNRPLTAELVLETLRERGNPIGQTTVYRNLDKLAKDGAVLRFVSPGDLSQRFQYVEHPESYHLVCTECGCMTHLDCRRMAELALHMKEEHGFSLDHGKTILYGHCQHCTGLLFHPEGGDAP